MKAKDSSEVQEIYNCVTRLTEKVRRTSANIQALQVLEKRFLRSIKVPEIAIWLKLIDSPKPEYKHLPAKVQDEAA